MEIKTYKEFIRIAKEKGLKGIVVIFGEESHLIDESIKLIYGQVKTFQELNIIKLDGENIRLDDIMNACETLPFMEEIKIVHIKSADFLSKSTRASQDFIKGFANYIKNQPEDITLLLTFEGAVDTSNPIYKMSKSIGLTVEYKSLKGEELQKWVVELFKRNGKNINKYEINYFILEVGNSLEQLEREVEKICAYEVDDTITKQDIDDVVHKSMESNIFKMVDNISKKDADVAIGILNALLFQREEHLKILGMIIRQIRLMFLIKTYLEEKKTSFEMNKALRLNEFVLNNLIKQSNNYKTEELKRLLSICLETDFKLKNGTYSHEFYGLALETLIVELCK